VTLEKGDTVTITGKLTQRTYTGKDNLEKTVYEVNAETLGADLRRTSFTKSGIKRVTENLNDAWSAPLSDNSAGVNF
jgi:single-stranded DNA-binding protein